MENVTHWTHQSTADFVYNISSDFVAQLETKMEEEDISRGALANRLSKTSGRVSQVFNNPGNLSLRVIVDYARALGMKVSLVAYDDGDSKNENGPINPDVFVKCWEKCNQPQDLFEVAAANSQIFYDVNLALNWALEEMPCLPADPHYVYVGAGQQTVWNSIHTTFEEATAKTFLPVGVGGPQEIINGIPFIANQLFTVKTGVVYAKQEAIGT
jgi:hypothetical protein